MNPTNSMSSVEFLFLCFDHTDHTVERLRLVSSATAATARCTLFSVFSFSLIFSMILFSRVAFPNPCLSGFAGFPGRQRRSSSDRGNTS